MKEGRRASIGRSRKTCLAHVKFIDSRANPGSQRFSQILVCGGGGLNHFGNSYSRTGVTGSADLGPSKVQTVPEYRDIGRRGVHPTKTSSYT